MAAEGSAGAAAPTQRDPGRPAYLELFFDLVYIFALITLAKTLAVDLTWTGVGETLVLLLAFTLVWAVTAWAADTLDLARPAVQVQFIGVAAASLLLAAAAPDAYGERGLLFAVTYLVIHLGSSSYYLLLLRDASEPRRSSRVLFWYLIAAVGWVGGGLAAGPIRLVLWAATVGVEYVAASLGWPAPRLGRAQPQEWRLVGERVAERYRQFVIVALGAALFVTGTTFSMNGYTLDRARALLVVFLIVVLAWRIYIYRAGELLTDAIARSTNPSLLTQSAAVTHLIMVAGIGGMAVTSHLVVVRPFGDTPASWAAVILGGPALFLVGRGVLDYTVFGRISRSRLAGLVLLAGVAPASSLLPPVLIALLAMTVLALVAAANLVSTRLHARTPRPPSLGGASPGRHGGPDQP
ncbi:low temperature requirement protein A [Micromonospora sp. 4G57]|uniref:Low temperature requirement protein A n=1 Tax=Micromonospora sicca TaxID=2202420 RepID=A0ABU5JBL2_9ACTN|nr:MULTISPECIES: low temperature requirement protein A [unclassified Micromonospora]MDZ5441587.1 low temperature requirement protein A [Micromonospora sp. 4G57]MDZ5489984.1 low temperature requirement protein A [Micromonospora sp. 4G53]